MGFRSIGWPMRDPMHADVSFSREHVSVRFKLLEQLVDESLTSYIGYFQPGDLVWLD